MQQARSRKELDVFMIQGQELSACGETCSPPSPALPVVSSGNVAIRSPKRRIFLQTRSYSTFVNRDDSTDSLLHQVLVGEAFPSLGVSLVSVKVNAGPPLGPSCLHVPVCVWDQEALLDSGAFQCHSAQTGPSQMWSWQPGPAEPVRPGGSQAAPPVPSPASTDGREASIKARSPAWFPKIHSVQNSRTNV